MSEQCQTDLIYRLKVTFSVCLYGAGWVAYLGSLILAIHKCPNLPRAGPVLPREIPKHCFRVYIYPFVSQCRVLKFLLFLLMLQKAAEQTKDARIVVIRVSSFFIHFVFEYSLFFLSYSWK